MYDHHILIFGQNSLLLHGGVPRIERLRVPSFCVLSQQNTYQASCILGESVSQRNFLVRDKKKFPSKPNVEIFTFGIVSRCLVVYSSYLAQT